MDGMIKLELPVKFDDFNDGIVDVKNRTIAILSWPQCGLDVMTIRDRANFLVERINSGMVKEFTPIPLESQKAVEVSSRPTIAEFVKKMFKGRKEKKVNKYYVPRVRKCIDDKGNVVELRRRGGLNKGWRLADLDKKIEKAG